MTFLNFRDQEHPIQSYELFYTKFTNQLLRKLKKKQQTVAGSKEQKHTQNTPKNPTKITEHPQTLHKRCDDLKLDPYMKKTEMRMLNMMNNPAEKQCYLASLSIE